MPSRQADAFSPAASPEHTTFLSSKTPRPRPRLLLPLLAAAALLTFVAILSAILLCRWRRRKGASRSSRTAPSSSPSSPTKPPDLKPRRFTYEQLCRATSSFSPSGKLGQGGFGSVFRGVLPSGEEVAVKLMDSGSLQGELEFSNELSLAASVWNSAAAAEPFSNGGDHVVFPIGFCSEDEDIRDDLKNKKKRKMRSKKKKRRKKNWFDNFDLDDDEEDVEEVEEENGVKKKMLLLVYKLMQNGSLQDALLVRKRLELTDWSRRFAVVVDVVRGLQFLHNDCNPPIVHGDIKPSNILLDIHFSAKIADFGLARRLLDESKVSVDPSGVVDRVDDCSVTTAAETESTLTALTAGGGGGFVVIGVDGEGEGSVEVEGEELSSPDLSPIKLEVASTSEVGGFDQMSMDSQMIDDVQSKNGRTSSKDYVMEWIGSEISKEIPKPNWATSRPATSANGGGATPSSEKKRQQKRLEWWASLDKERSKKGRSRLAREWWREEFCEELAKKNEKKKKRKQMPNSNVHGRVGGGEKQWWQSDDDDDFGTSVERRNRKKRGWSRSSRPGTDGCSGELRMTGRSSSRDWASGDIPRSGGMSSTPSMRGTVCYAAPECGGEVLSEKCDIYSFGVLVLVIISGRRPLQVTASPMSEFERANLISWARNLARKGNLLDLVDSSLRAVDANQALLCITIALLCLQRSPARRPSIKEVMGMLSGDLDPPQLPVELSRSPASAFSNRSRKKVR